jgi:hypothetical protein
MSRNALSSTSALTLAWGAPTEVGDANATPTVVNRRGRAARSPDELRAGELRDEIRRLRRTITRLEAERQALCDALRKTW